MSRLLLSVALIVVANGVSVFAQTTVTSDEKAEIASLWNDIGVAVRLKDRKALERIYSEDFVHVHAVGKIDDRKRRLDVLLSGEATIDSAGTVEIGFRKYGDVVVAVGKVKMPADGGNTVEYAVTRVYARQVGRWRFVSSHASPLAVE